jgi:hypothetical protein
MLMPIRSDEIRPIVPAERRGLRQQASVERR